jgi:MFS family permease
LNPYITSSFGKHGLLNVVSILSTVLSGATKLTLAKIVDIWGRIEGFIVMLLIVTIGLIMKATCQTIEVYVGAHVLYWTGHIGLMYIIDIMIADMTTLKNRMIIAGINGTPTICSTFAGPKIAELFYTNVNFRWAFGAFAIMQVGICLPVFLVMLLEQRKAAKQGLIKPKESSGRNIVQSLWYYFIELDGKPTPRRVLHPPNPRFECTNMC